MKAAVLFTIAICGLANVLHAASDVTVKGGLAKGGKFKGANPRVFTPSKANASAGRGLIQGTLNGGRGVTIKTQSAAGAPGDLTIATALAKTKGKSAPLRFEAVRDIAVNGAISTTKTLPLIFSAGRAISSTAAISSNGADITIDVAESFVVGEALSAGAGKVVLQSGRLESTTAQTVTASSVEISQGAAWRLRGSVAGDLSVAGVVAPGAQGTESLQISGALSLQPTATTVINLGGSSSANYGRIGVTGAVVLDGALQVDFVNGFEDAISSGNTFTILSAGSISGRFAGLENDSRLILPDDLGSVKITYTATSVTLSDWQPIIVDLTWDPGESDAGTQVFTSSRPRGRRHYFRMHSENTDIGAWRTRLTTTTAEADLYMSLGGLPSTVASRHRSKRVGADGFVLNQTEFAAGQEWFLLVDADPGTVWTLVSGRAFVQDLGSLGWTDANASGTYDIGEAIVPSGSGLLAIGGEGMRFYKTVVPNGTPAWSLWLYGSTQEIAVRRGVVPFHSARAHYDRKQAGQMLVVPPSLGSGTATYFVSVVGNPGESVGLDSRIQEVTDIAFDSSVTNVAVPDAPYRVYRVQVPVQQIAWDVSTVALSGDPNVVVRRDTVPAELDNDAFSEVPGTASDSITLVPNYLTDGTWYITVYGSSPYSFTLRNGPPEITPLPFAGSVVNDRPARTGWRFYALTDIPAQLGAVGWELQLSNHLAGTEIGVRRNAVPSRWRSREDGSNTIIKDAAVEFSGLGGFLQRPGHQADIWYVGIYLPTEALGAFTLTCFPIEPPTIAFDGGTQSGTNLEPGRWQFVRVEVPPGATGWDVRTRDTNGVVPVMIVRRDLLPIDTAQTWSPSTAGSWPSGNQWHAGTDWTGYTLNPGSISVPPRLVAGMTRPLQAGTYYVGVLNNGSAGMAYTIDSRGIGGARTYPVTDLAYSGGSANITDLAPREANYFRVTIPPNAPSWEVTVATTAGDIELLARRGTVPDFTANVSGSVYSSDVQVEMQKVGAERYVLLPPLGAAFIPPDDYYLAVVSEGTGAVGSIIGNVTSSAAVTSLGPLAIADLGTATAAGRSEAVTLEAGQIKAFQFTVPDSTYSLEVRLENRIGAPSMSVVPGALLPTPAATYGNDGGNGGYPTSAGPADSIILTAANPSSGVWSVNVNAGTTVGASATLIVKAIGLVPLPFDGGTVAVVDHQPATVRYFEVNVPAGVAGWDLRLRDVVGPHPPMVVRPDLLPGIPGTNWAPWTALTWTAGNWWQGGVDWTGYSTNPGGTAVPPRLVMGMGRPLRPGTFYVAVFNDSTTEAISYTIDSRGIGAGQTYPTPDLAYVGGNADISNLAPREPKYFKVSIPPNTPSWEITLAPTAGEMEMLVRRDTVADFAASMTGAIYSAGTGAEVEMQKVGPERYVLLPAPGQAFLPTADYYVSVVSEGVSPASSTIGTGVSSGQVTSVGPLAITDLGMATPASSTHPVSLVSGQIKAYQFIVPAGTDSLELRLENTTGFPAMSLGEGALLPVPPGTSPLGSLPYSEYGFDGGNLVLQNAGILTVANPVPGVWSVLVRARHDGQSAFPPATADLVVTALSTVALAFDGGNFSINGQPQNTWRYFAVDVPAGAMGWDIRLRDLTGPLPAMMVRRDLLPIIPPNQSTPGHIPGGWIARASTAWTIGNQWHAGTDWTGYNLNAAGVPVPPRMVAGMGRPLEAGRYYIGVLNNTNAPTSYTIDSRGIGAGLTYTITDLPFDGGTAPITELAGREAQYFKVSIPANTPSWEVTLGSTIGDLELLLRRTTVPDFGAAQGGSIYTGSEGLEVEMQKRGAERYVLLPSAGQDFVTAGDYYLAVVSEGVNPTSTTIGTGAASGDLASRGILQVANLGVATSAGLTEPVALAGGQVKAYHFDVAAGTHSIELRLENMIGFPAMSLIQGARLPVPPGSSPIGTFPYSEYGHDGGTTGTQAVNIQTVPNPGPGVWSVVVRAGHDSQNAFPDGSANLIIRQKQNIPLNLAASQNANGGTNTDTRQAIDGEYNIYEVTVPALLEGQPVLGWIIQTEILQGAASFVAYKDFANPSSGITLPTGFAVIVPPYLAAGDVFYIRVKATGFTEYRITSRPVTLERPVWQMPVAHNLTFGDSGDDSSGAPLPGDRGIDLEQGFWHFYAIDVPAGNSALLRTELQAISGNPDLYIREDGVPTTYHLSGGATGSSLVHRTLTGATTSYGNWVPLDGRTQKSLRPGRWYLGVRASGTSNVRYRLIASTGAVKELALDPASALPQLPSSVTEHSIADNDWRYYRFTIPPNAPKNWIVTFSQQVGDVVLWLRDTIPPGQKTANGSTSFDIASWSSDAKNQGPYIDGQDPVGAYTLMTPPLRPGHAYYAGFRSKNSATFSVSSDTGGGLIGPLPSLDFYTGTVTTSVPANGSLLYEIPVPVEGTRLKWSSTNSASVSIRMEQGTLPTSSGSQHFAVSSANASFNQALSPTAWPWQPGQTYYVRFVNSTASAEPITFTMNGKNAENEDEDADGLLDAWERQYFNSLGYTSASDPDADGVTNAVEYVDGTNPNSASSAKYTLTVLAINGAADANPVQAKYDKGTVLTITNTADPGYIFVGWSGGPFRGDDFVMRATGTITFPTDGTWTFGVNAADGGVLRVNGVTLFSDDTQHEARDRFAEITLPAGSYPLELIAFERTGSEAVELFAAAGSHSTFNAAFALVGDLANGGLAISSVSGGNAVPEFTIRQVEAVSHQISSLVAANNLLAGSYAAARDVTALLDVVNFLTYDFSEGHFGANAHFPLSAGIEDAPLSLTMNANYAITALHSLPLDAAADAPLVWVTGGNIPWLGENSASAFDGVDAVRSGPIGDGQNSAVRTTVTGPGTLTFHWKVSSQTGDNLAVQLDGVQQAVISGEVAWVQRVVNVSAGAHTVTWIYSKNASGAAGSDTGWIDQVVFTPAP